MKKIVWVILSFVFIVALNSCMEQKETKMTKEDLKTDDQRSSYTFGVDIGKMVSLDEQFDIEAFMQGVNDKVEGVEILLTADEMKLVREKRKEEKTKIREGKQPTVKGDQAAFTKTNKASETNIESGNNILEGEKFLADNKKKDGVKVTVSGLQYKVITEGKGVKPKAGDKIKVHYAGSLIDGEEFDSSYKRGEPISFKLDQVIKGWQEGLSLMPVGSKYMLYVPSKLAYGKNSKGTIPANSVLIFEVELLKIIK